MSIKKIIYKIKQIPKEIKFFIQRGKRGWSDRDARNSDIYLLTIILQLIGYLRADEYLRVPQKFIDKYGEKEGAVQYNVILSDIQTLFRRVLIDYYENVYYDYLHNSIIESKTVSKELSDHYWHGQERLSLVKKDDFNTAWEKLGEVFDSLWI